MILTHYFDNSDQPSAGTGHIDLVDPVSEEVYGRSVAGEEPDVAAAVGAAERALAGEWSSMGNVARGALLFRLADLVERDAEMIAEMDASAIGRLRNVASFIELPNAIATLRNAAGWADKIEGRTIPTPGVFGAATLSYTRHEPVGVVAAIVPWNGPFMITCWKIASALAAGCTVVIKPAEETPQSALHLAALAKEAGFPAGVINVVLGRGEVVGAALCWHPSVAKISFTGSTAVGRKIAALAGSGLKRVALELGGKSPQIIFDDADFDRAVEGCAIGIFSNQGQICAAGSRILVQRSLADRFSAALAEHARTIVVGDPVKPTTQMGAVAKKSQLESINRYIKSGLDEGATLLAGGPSGMEAGWFVRPTVFGNANNKMTIAREEIFGPVATIIPFDSEEDAIALANDSEYGLSATIWTRDVARAHRCAGKIKAGAVAVNCWAPIDAHLPWGGVGASGVGRECGLSGILAYTEEKVVTVLLA